MGEVIYPPGTMGAELQKLRRGVEGLPRWVFWVSPKLRRARRLANDPDPFRLGENLPPLLREWGLDEAAQRIEKL